MENISNYRNVWYEHGIKVFNGILFMFDYKFNKRGSSCTVEITLILIQYNIIE